MSNRLRASWLPAAIAMSLLAGCAAQMQPVADFGASANHLAGAYKPFASGLEDSCEQQQRYVALSAPGNYDDEVVWRDAAAFCAQYKQAGAEAAAIADGLSAYGVALVKLSGARATVFDSDIRQASSQLGAITRDGEHAGLVAASNAAAEPDVPRALPWRLAQQSLRADIDANKAAHAHVLAFDDAADALLKAHADLIANFDTLSGVKKLQLVQDFVAKVQALKAGTAL